MFTCMLRMLPSESFICTDPSARPSYIDINAPRTREEASAIVKPANDTGPTFDIKIFPSGDTVALIVICESPHTSTITSSPGPST